MSYKQIYDGSVIEDFMYQNIPADQKAKYIHISQWQEPVSEDEDEKDFSLGTAAETVVASEFLTSYDGADLNEGQTYERHEEPSKDDIDFGGGDTGGAGVGGSWEEEASKEDAPISLDDSGFDNDDSNDN